MLVLRVARCTRGASTRSPTRDPGKGYVHPDLWRSRTETTEGSWWPTWNKWLLDHSGARVSARAIGAADAGYAPICDAPGNYVHL